MKQKVIISQIEVFVLFVATISGLLIFFSRIGLDNDIIIILKSVGLSYLIILFNLLNAKIMLKC